MMDQQHQMLQYVHACFLASQTGQPLPAMPSTLLPQAAPPAGTSVSLLSVSPLSELEHNCNLKASNMQYLLLCAGGGIKFDSSVGMGCMERSCRTAAVGGLFCRLVDLVALWTCFIHLWICFDTLWTCDHVYRHM